MKLIGESLEKALIEVGDGLKAIDQVREENFAGFNRIDWDRWSQVRGCVYKMQKLLKKYHRQIPTDLYETCGLKEFKPKCEIQLSFKENELFAAISDIPKNKFEEQRIGHHSFGFKFNYFKQAWGLSAIKIESFNYDLYKEKFELLGFEVGALPEMKLEPEKDESASEALERLDRRRLKNTVVVTQSDKGLFSFRFPYSGHLNELFSNKTGKLSGIFEYNPKNYGRETYEVELVQEAIEKIKEILPEWKIITEGLEEAIVENKKEIEELRKPIPEVEALLAEGFELLPFQNEGVRFFQRTNGNSLLGDEMGLGKTLESLAWLAIEEKRAFAIVPKTVRRKWVQESHKFFPTYFKARELTPKKDKDDLSQYNLVTINPTPVTIEKWKNEILAGGFDTLIFDESHLIKNPNAKITKLVQEIAPHFKHIILLSGTMIKNKKVELHTQVQLVASGLLGTRKQLKNATIGGTWNKLKPIYLARQKKQVLKELPDLLTSIVEIDIKGLPIMPKSLDIGDISRLKNDIALGKIDTTVEFVKDILITSNSSSVVFTESREAAIKIQEKLGSQAVLHHGKMSDEKREQVKYDFQNTDKYRVFVTTRQSVAVGADLYKADKVVFNDLPWNPADLRQAHDRTHRIGQKNTVNVYWMIAKDHEWDLKVSKIIFKKYDLSKKLNEGKQLSKEDREWMEKPVSLEDIRSTNEIS